MTKQVKQVKIVDYGSPKGRGVIAAEVIKKGEYVASYLGEPIFKSEADRRDAEKYAGAKHYYLFETHAKKRNPATGKLERIVIDATAEDPTYGYGRLINCSRRDANLRPVLTTGGEIQFYAKRDIDIGEELYYDYNPGGTLGFKVV